MARIERGLQVGLFFTRWLLLAFTVGLMLCLLLLVYRFFADFYQLALKVPDLSWHALVVEILNLVDLALTANLLLIVVFSSYENFIHKLDREGHAGWPDGLTDVNFGALKQKVLGSIVVIASVDALAWHLDLEKYTDTSKLRWALAFPLTLVVTMLLMSVSDRLSRRDQKAE